MRRVAIVGSGGAGKTTFARELSQRTGLPVVHLDHLYWSPGWVETPSEEWRIRLRERLRADEWIADGNYAGTYDVRFSRADTVIVLALSKWTCVSRVLWRSLANHGRSVQAEGCPERIDLKFLKWVWRYPSNSRPLLDAAIQEFGTTLTVIELRSRRDARDYLAKSGPETSSAGQGRIESPVIKAPVDDGVVLRRTHDPDDVGIAVAHAYEVLSDASLKSVTMVRDPDTTAARAKLMTVDLHDVLVAYLLFARDLRLQDDSPAIARGVALRHARRIAGELLFAQPDSMQAIRTFVNLTLQIPEESLELALGSVSSAGIMWTSEMADTDVLGHLTRDVYNAARIANADTRADYLARHVYGHDFSYPTQREFALAASEQWPGTLIELIEMATTLRPIAPDLGRAGEI